MLFDRFHRCDMAVKVVGVGSVGTMCMIALFMAADDDPLFLQIKQANASVLEPYAGKSLHGNHGQRVVVGQRLMQSPFTFYRGSAVIMAADLAPTPASGIRVQACGDAHLSNFGGFATPERRIVFDINDFDETLPAPWEWDLKRLAASVVVAGRQIGRASCRERV